jgi:predicted N-acetyltransferase YhbS
VNLHAAETEEDIARMRAFISAEQGQAAVRALDRQLERPRYRSAFTRVAERGGQLAGYALIGHERRRLGATTLEAGQLAAVYVRPAQRQQGIFEALIGDCLGALLEHGLPLAFLRGRAEEYTPFGFAPYRFAATVELGAESRSGDQLPGALRPAVSDDLDDIAALYAASYRNLPLAEVRVAPDWRWWLGQGHAALVLEDSRGRVVAYASGDPPASTDRLCIAEASAADAGVARGLVAALLAHARSQGLDRLSLALPPAQPVAQAALLMGGVARLAATLVDGEQHGEAALAGVVDLPGMLEALAPEFERRLAGSRYAGWSGNLRVEIETERVTLALAAGRAMVIDGSRPADVRLRRVALPALAQLCLGYRAAADLRATGGLDCDDSTLGLLDALFPVVLA